MCRSAPLRDQVRRSFSGRLVELAGEVVGPGRDVQEATKAVNARDVRADGRLSEREVLVELQRIDRAGLVAHAVGDQRHVERSNVGGHVRGGHRPGKDDPGFERRRATVTALSPETFVGPTSARCQGGPPSSRSSERLEEARSSFSVMPPTYP
jgi:hypothetical protein